MLVDHFNVLQFGEGSRCPRIHLMPHTNRVRETYTEHARSASYTGDNFASMSSVLNEWPFREMPNSRSCDAFSVRLQIVLFTLGF